MILVELFSKPDCHLCEEAIAVLEEVKREIPFALKEHLLTEGHELYEEYKELVPVVHINRAFAFKYKISPQLLKMRLRQVEMEIAARKRNDDE